MAADACRQQETRFDPNRAIRAQLALSRLLKTTDDYGVLRSIAGLDVAYVRLQRMDLGIGVAVVVSVPELRVKGCFYSVRPVCVPYIPGLLAFREMAVLAPLLARMIERGQRPDLVIVDGHGTSHPRRFGIACHVGVAFNLPSVGAAKRRLYGEEVSVSGRTYIVDPRTREKLGVVLGAGSRRIYVSPGHRVSLITAARIVGMATVKGRAMPEPTRLADSYSKALKRAVASRPQALVPSALRGGVEFGDCASILRSISP